MTRKDDSAPSVAADEARDEQVNRILPQRSEARSFYKFEDTPRLPRAAAREKRAHGRHRKQDQVPTELDLADRLVERFGSDLRYCAQLGGWHFWTGKRWERDEREKARECAKDIARELAREAAEEFDKDLLKAAKDASRAAGVTAILNHARSAPGIVFTADEANRDPWLLNVANGTLHLETGELRSHDRADLITRCAPVEYDASATAPTFERFLSEIQPDPEVRSYLARLFGYAAIGLVREHVLGVLWGPGGNGKSVLADVVTYALGDYAKPGPSSLIVQAGDHEPHPTDVASCAESRLVVLHETRRGVSFDASKVKLLTGGDQLTARFMRQDFFTFTPTHTLVMLSNYRPKADASDAALWRRIHLVPFTVIIPEEDRDPQLAERIKRDEAGGVLAWVVRGALEYQRIGLAPPVAVLEQTAAYRQSEDLIGEFLAEQTLKQCDARVGAGVLYDAYKRWCGANGHRAVRGNDFATELRERCFERSENSKGRWYLGIELIAEGADR